MSQIPNDLAISAAQTPFQARQATAEDDARRAGEANAASRQVKATTEEGTTVETTDADVAVFADAEGSGSQGRPFEQAAAEEQQEPLPPTPTGITHDADGRLHIDLEA